MSQNASDAPPEEPSGLLLCRDLFFVSKVTGTARALGYLVKVASSPARAEELIAQGPPKVVFVDLAAGDLVAGPALLAYQKAAGPATPFVAFGSHVDTVALADARAAGCDPVLARSKFTAELPELIRHYFQKARRVDRRSGIPPCANERPQNDGENGNRLLNLYATFPVTFASPPCPWISRPPSSSWAS